MKDVKTNLENMGNIVGPNVILMEHQLKSELEKSVIIDPSEKPKEVMDYVRDLEGETADSSRNGAS